jgi:hypothetical protein
LHPWWEMRNHLIFFLCQGWLLEGLLTYQTLRKASGVYATSLTPFGWWNNLHKSIVVSFWTLFDVSFLLSIQEMVQFSGGLLPSLLTASDYIISLIVFCFYFLLLIVEYFHVLLDCILPSQDSA